MSYAVPNCAFKFEIILCVPGVYTPGTQRIIGLSGGYTVNVTAINVTNLRVLLDNSLTFGGYHWNLPREIYAEFRWRFHY